LAICAGAGGAGHQYRWSKLIPGYNRAWSLLGASWGRCGTGPDRLEMGPVAPVGRPSR
jgi:hypothetical protein